MIYLLNLLKIFKDSDFPVRHVSLPLDKLEIQPLFSIKAAVMHDDPTVLKKASYLKHPKNAMFHQDRIQKVRWVTLW